MSHTHLPASDEPSKMPSGSWDGRPGARMSSPCWPTTISRSANGAEFELADYAQAAKTLDSLDDVARIIETVGPEGFVSLLRCFSIPDSGDGMSPAKSARLSLGSISNTFTELSRLPNHRSKETKPSGPTVSMIRATSSKESSVLAA